MCGGGLQGSSRSGNNRRCLPIGSAVVTRYPSNPVHSLVTQFGVKTATMCRVCCELTARAAQKASDGPYTKHLIFEGISVDEAGKQH